MSGLVNVVIKWQFFQRSACMISTPRSYLDAIGRILGHRFIILACEQFSALISHFISTINIAHHSASVNDIKMPFNKLYLLKL